MLILALDSTSLSASVAICNDEQLVSEFTLHTGHTHSETLLPMIEAVLSISGFTVDDIDLFVCTAGPGSFTGVRIGAATIKGLAFSKEKPCLGVSTLESLAQNGASHHAILCPVMNARREQVYQAFFESDGRIAVRLCDDRALAISELGDEMEQLYADRPIYLMGDGASLVYEALCERLKEHLSLHMLPERLIYQSGYNTAMVGLRLWQRGIRTTEAELSPVYLRPSQAERMRMATLEKQEL